MPADTPLLALNLLFIDGRPLSGPGYYAVQLFDELIRQAEEDEAGSRLIAYVQADAVKHFSSGQISRLKVQPAMPGRVARVLWEQIVLPIICLRDRVDLLFSPGFVSPLWGPKYKVVTVCDMYYRVIPEMIPAFQRLYWSVAIPLSAKVCQSIITISEHSKSDIEAYIPASRGKVISIPLASRFSVTAPVREASHPLVVEQDIAADPPFVLMVANLTPNKNVEVVVEAVARLRRQGVDIEFLHAGSDPYGRLSRSVEANELALKARSLGKVSDEVLAGLYRRCLAVVTPSTYEGFGLPALEAQAMGAPLISSNRTALTEVAGPGALYFDPGSAEQLGHRILEIRGLSEAERNSVIARGRRHAENYSWAITASRTRDILMRVLRERHMEAR